MTQKTEYEITVDLSPENLALVELEARRLRNQYIGAAFRGGVTRLKALLTDRGGNNQAVPDSSALTRGA